MVLKRSLKYEIDKFFLLLEVALKVKRAKLRDIEFKISSLF